jgi:hypothetical protein
MARRWIAAGRRTTRSQGGEKCAAACPSGVHHDDWDGGTLRPQASGVADGRAVTRLQLHYFIPSQLHNFTPLHTVQYVTVTRSTCCGHAVPPTADKILSVATIGLRDIDCQCMSRISLEQQRSGSSSVASNSTLSTVWEYCMQAYTALQQTLLGQHVDMFEILPKCLGFTGRGMPVKCNLMMMVLRRRTSTTKEHEKNEDMTCPFESEVTNCKEERGQ